MKIFKSTILCVAFLFAIQAGAVASDITDRGQALNLFKKYINNMVQRVEKAEDPAKKREILNSTFDNMITAFDAALGMGIVSAADKRALNTLRTNILEKKNELNGADGYRRVADNNLNNFANYVQQDLEQADTVTITISVTLLIVILLILLLL